MVGMAGSDGVANFAANIDVNLTHIAGPDLLNTGVSTYHLILVVPYSDILLMLVIFQ